MSDTKITGLSADTSPTSDDLIVTVDDPAGTVTIYISDGTTPDGNLTGVQGDYCLNGPSGVPYYCDANGTNWTAVA